MKNIGLLILRLTVGTLMAGHGAQKLFGWFSGPGLKGTHGFMEMLGMKPGKVWGTAAAVGEFSGGVLTGLGLLFPIGPQNIAGAMTVAIRRVHWKTPIWASAGGAELPLTNLAIAWALCLIGPGRYSLDRALGIKMPRWLLALTWANHIGVTAAALLRPEIADTVVQKVSQVLPMNLAPSGNSSDVEVETRPRTAEQQPEEQQANA